MSENYQRSWEILWEARKTDGANCLVSPDGALGPCVDCMHCHPEAQRIEEMLDENPNSLRRIIEIGATLRAENKAKP